MPVPGLVDRDSLSLDSTWIPVLVECPCDTRGCIWFLAYDDCLHHFHFSGFFWRNSTISLAVLPVPCSLATRWRKSGIRRLPYAFAHTSYAFFTLSSTRACAGHRSAVACSVSFPHTRQPKGRTGCSPRTAMFHAFAQAFQVLFGAGQFLFEVLRDLEDYPSCGMDPDFHRTIIEFSSTHFLDHKLNRCLPCVTRCREL